MRMSQKTYSTRQRLTWIKDLLCPILSSFGKNAALQLNANISCRTFFSHSCPKLKRNVKKFTKKSYTVKQLKSSCFSFLGCELINISPFFRLSHALELLRDVFSTNFNQYRNRSKRKKKNCYAKVNINPGPPFTNLSTFKGYNASKSNANKRSTNMKKNY